MKKIFHKIMSFTMAIVVLFSTMSFSIDMHYCGDTLIDTAIFHKVETCGMEMQTSTSKDCAVTEKNCCNDEQFVVDGQDQLQHAVDKLTFQQEVFIASFLYAYNNLFEGVEENINSYRDFSTSFVVRDIYKLDESYLI